LFEDSNGPLYNFSDEIKIGYAIGLYNEHVYKGLEVVCDIRNIVAHTQHDFSFNTPYFLAEIKKLIEEIWENYTFTADPDNAAAEFVHAAASLTLEMEKKTDARHLGSWGSGSPADARGGE
jgi:DNA-binding MltR family transcriptional regulator